MTTTAAQANISEIAQEALQAAHDIRSPIMALQAILSTMEHMDARKKNLAHAALDRLQEITDGLLEKYRNKVEATAASENLKNVIEQVIEEKRILLPNEIIIEKRLESGLEISTARAKELRRIISNLLNNSIEAIYKKSNNGVIKILVKQIDGDVVVSVEDNGIGIPESCLNLLGHFGISFGKKNGHGLGLSRAKEIMRQWGGQLMVESIENEYARVTLCFKI